MILKLKQQINNLPLRALTQAGFAHAGVLAVAVMAVIAVVFTGLQVASNQNDNGLLGASGATSSKLEGRLLIYNDYGPYKRAAIGVSTRKGQLASPIPDTQAYCIVNHTTYKLADQAPERGSRTGQFLYVDLPKHGARSLQCSSSSFLVYYLKKGWSVNDAEQYSRAAPSVSTGYCTYVQHASRGEVSAEEAAFNTDVDIQKANPNGTCPSVNLLYVNTPAHKEKAELKATYDPPVIKQGQKYSQIFELSLRSGEAMSPQECGGQISISHPDINTPARNYSIRYYAKPVERHGKMTKICRFVEHVKASASAHYAPKIDSLLLCFSGNKFVEGVCNTQLIDRQL